MLRIVLYLEGFHGSIGCAWVVLFGRLQGVRWEEKRASKSERNRASFTVYQKHFHSLSEQFRA